MARDSTQLSSLILKMIGSSGVVLPTISKAHPRSEFSWTGLNYKDRSSVSSTFSHPTHLANPKGKTCRRKPKLGELISLSTITCLNHMSYLVQIMFCLRQLEARIMMTLMSILTAGNQLLR